MTRRWLRAGMASLLLLVIGIGVPAGLIRWGRWPVRGMPTAEQVGDLPNTIVSDTAVFGILTLAAGAIWALFMMSVVREAWAQGAGRDIRPGPVPSVLHRHAARLVGAILMTASVVGPATRSTAVANASPLAPAERGTPAPAEQVSAPIASQPAAPEAVPPPLPEIEVKRGDNPWDLATTHLGDPMRWRELFELNRGRPQLDGRAWTAPDVIEPGWRLRLPADASVTAGDPVDQYTVRPGDSLSEIARDELGSIDRYPEIFERNEGRPQPDGLSLADPDLIRPGWVLALPDEPASGTLAPEPEVAPAPPTSLPPTPMPDPVPATLPTPTTAVPPSSEAAPVPADDAAERSDRVPVGLIGGGVATAGLLAVLERRRRAGLRRRDHGTTPTPLSPAAAVAEQRLRAGAAPDRAGRVDSALRAVRADTSTDQVPTRVEVDETSVRLHGMEEAPVGLFQRGAHGAWETHADVAALEEAGRSQAPPFPGLCPVGVDATGAEVLLDLGASSFTTIEASDEVRAGVLQSMAVALSTGPWVLSPSVITVGLGDVSYLDIEEAESLSAALGALDVSMPAAPSEARRVAVVLSNEAPKESDKPLLQRLADRGVVLVSPPSTGCDADLRVRVDDDGVAVVTTGDVQLEVAAHRIDRGELASVNELLDHAASGFAPPEPARIDLRDPAGAKPHSIGMSALVAELEVVVNVLGEVCAEHVAGDERTRITVGKQRALEAIAYIALRESSVDREDVQAALWPDGTNSAKTFANAIWEARRVLGHDRDGADLLPDAAEGRYTLSPRVGTDYGLFCELVETADKTDSADAAADLLSEALDLVRGEPFIGVGRSYAWVGPHRGMIATQVLDAAEELAEVRLAAGDWRGAEWAARQGLRAMPCDERMYRLLMRAADAAGNTAGVHRAFKELCEVLADPDDGVEPDDTVHPETISLMEELTSAARSSRATA